jgi:RNA-directed DNA polymerase
LYSFLKKRKKSYGFIKGDNLFPTDSGTPQGEIISPILANKVLDGIEAIVKFLSDYLFLARHN